MSSCNEENVNNLLGLVFDAPLDEEMVKLDCNDYCEQLAEIAEQVAGGKSLTELLPDWEQHIQYWKDCREEFEALVAILKAENELPPNFAQD